MSHETMEETLTIIDEEGIEREMNILFTFAMEDSGKNYVLYYDPQQPQGDVFVSSYTEEGQLFPIEDEEEWDMVEEVFNTFMSGEEPNQDHDHTHDHDHHHHHHDHGHDHDHDHHHHDDEQDDERH